MWRFFLLAFCFTLVNCSQHNLFTAVPNAFFKDCLSEINTYRKLHGAIGLRWSDDLQYHAQTRADKLASDEFLQNNVEVGDRLGQGETVSYLSPPKELCRTYPPSGDCYACRDVIATWYNESKYYNYNTGYSLDGTKQVLDFTQVVWKDSIKVGLATALSPRYGIITVARYHPRGNIGFLDEYIRNVAPRGSNDGFSGNDGDGDQGGPPCRKRKATIPIVKDCVNEYGDDLCNFYAELDKYCEYNADFMKASCAKSCGFCERRAPAPPVMERKDDIKHELHWQVGKWLECHGGFQRRSVKCFRKNNDRDYLLRNKICRHELGNEPAKYKDCPLGI